MREEEGTAFCYKLQIGGKTGMLSTDHEDVGDSGESIAFIPVRLGHVLTHPNRWSASALDGCSSEVATTAARHHKACTVFACAHQMVARVHV